MDDQGKGLQRQKKDMLSSQQAQKHLQNQPARGQQSAMNVSTEHNTASDGTTETQSVPQQPVKVLSTEPLSARRGAQMLNATQEAQETLDDETTLTFICSSGPSSQENTPVSDVQSPSASHVALESESALTPDRRTTQPLPVAQSQTALAEALDGALPQDVLPGSLQEQPSGNMLPADLTFSTQAAAGKPSGNSEALSPGAQPGWQQWIAKLQAWKLFGPSHAILLFAPITWTWLSIGLASLAYSQSLEKNPELVGVPFLQMWVEGFPELKGGIWHLPLILDVGVTVFLLLVLALFTWVANYPVTTETSEVQTKEETTLLALNGAVVELHDILAALKTPVAAIEASVAKMGGSYANFESIAGQIRSSFNELSSAAPLIRKDLNELNDAQKGVMRGVRESSKSMEDAAEAMRTVAEPFRKEGIDTIIQDAVERMKKLDILQQGISQQQRNIYTYQQELQAGIETQLDVLNQQVRLLQQMRASQQQVDITQIIQALEQAGYSLQREYTLVAWLRKGQKWLKNKLTA